MMDNSQNAVNIFNKLAKHYQDKFMDTSMYHETFDIFCSHIKKQNAGILELACGPGNITQYLLSRRPDFNILGIDLAPNMIELAKVNNPQAVFQVMDCRGIAALENKYDGIMCGFCLPYLSKDEVKKLIFDVADLLNTGGILYISTMEDDYSKSGLRKGSTGDEIFMHYYTAKDLADELDKNGFVVMELQRIIYQQKEGEQTADLILIAMKQNSPET